MEMLADGRIFHTAIHGPTTVSPGVWKQSTDGMLGGVDLSQDFHTYGIYREPGLVRVLIDGTVVGTYRRSEMPAGASWPFDNPMYLNLNIAVGGIGLVHRMRRRSSPRICWSTGSGTRHDWYHPNVTKNASGADARCRCGHPLAAHEQYRGGSECVQCKCDKFRSSGSGAGPIRRITRSIRSRLSRSSDSPAPPSLHSVPKKDVHRSPHERGGKRFGVA